LPCFICLARELWRQCLGRLRLINCIGLDGNLSTIDDLKEKRPLFKPVLH
jgi:hypothetical protein